MLTRGKLIAGFIFPLLIGCSNPTVRVIEYGAGGGLDIGIADGVIGGCRIEIQTNGGVERYKIAYIGDRCQVTTE